MAFKEIVTKAVIGKGKKKYKNTYQIEVNEVPTTVLGCWIINHNFEAKENGDNIIINGSYDANVWYSYDNDTKTAVVNKTITYQESEKLSVGDNNVINRDIIVRSLKQPTCISAKEDGRTINLEIEKELGIEIVGDTKVKISSVDDGDDDWLDLDKASDDQNIDSVNPDYLKENLSDTH